MPPRRGSRGGRGQRWSMPSKPRTQPKQLAPRASQKAICTCIGPQQFKHNHGHNEPIDCSSIPHNAFLRLPCSKLESLGLLPPPSFLSSLSKESDTGRVSEQDHTVNSSQNQPGYDIVTKFTVTESLAAIPNNSIIGRVQENETPQSLHQKLLQPQAAEYSRTARVKRPSLHCLRLSPSAGSSTPKAPTFSPITPDQFPFEHEVRSSQISRTHLQQSLLSGLQIEKDQPIRAAEFDLDMAPVRDPNNVQSSIKEVIQNLYDVQNQVHGYVPETQAVLVDKMTELAGSLSHLQKLTNEASSPTNPIHGVHIAPEIIDYVDDGRNPDIYTRDFVELVQRGNSVMNGKQQAFRDFSEIFAQVLKDKLPQLSDQVDKVMENARTKVPKQADQEERRNGKNGTNAL